MSSSALLHPLVSADVALFSLHDETLQVLLVQRSQEPAMHRWALPGAVLKPQQDRDLEACARRALRDKVSVEIPHLEQVRAFGGADRDPRGWSVSVLYYALLPRHLIDATAKSKVEAIKWCDADRTGHRLAFDHGLLLYEALSRLRDKVERQALPLHLMRDRFTLTDLQRACEAVLGRAIDKSVFRRRLKSSADIVEVSGEFAAGPQRPAQLYSARDGFAF